MKFLLIFDGRALLSLNEEKNEVYKVHGLSAKNKTSARGSIL